MMEKTGFGKTSLVVSRLCIGCIQATNWASCDEQQFVRTVRHALDRGLNFLDTAVTYGNGRSEELVGMAIAGRRSEVVLATKFPVSQSAPNDIRLSLEQSLKRLRTDYLDLYQQHWPSPIVPLFDTIEELERLKQEGKIRAIGVSNWMEPEWAELNDPTMVDALQPCYNLLWRSIERAVLPLCRQHNIAVIPYAPLCQGVLAGRFRKLAEIPNDMRRRNRRLLPDVFDQTIEIVRALEEVARKYGKTAGQVALRWLLDQPGITAVIVGASSPEQVDENIGAMGWQLNSDDWQFLSHCSRSLSENLEPYDTLWGWHSKR